MSDLFLARGQGLGDVLMALGAAKSLAHRGHTVHLSTCREFIPLVSRCPHIATINAHYAGWYACLDDARFGIADKHQIDAYLDAFGIQEPDPEMKRIEIAKDPEAEQFVHSIASGPRIAVLHPALTDPNRTWPEEHWQGLVHRLKEKGYTVVQIGKDGNGKGTLRLSGVVQTMNMLNLSQTLEMIRMSEVFISTDSGPVQMAGATDTRIVVIYSSVDGRNRIPYGANAAVIQAPCRMEGCYRYMHDPATWAKHSHPVLNDTFRLWCPTGDRYACLSRVTPDMVVDAI
jgi:ADP-heptose:LPS heptosyltransferase